MNISIVTLFPDLYDPFLKTSLMHKAISSKAITVDMLNLFNTVGPKERIDAPSYGHGAGMLIRPDCIEQAVDTQEKLYGSAYKIFFSPQGKKLDQNLLKSIFESVKDKGHILLLPARYEGMDARVESYYADCILSIGDYVLMGGDLPAMVFLEGFCRLLPNVVGKIESVENESFSGPFLDYPEYCYPLIWKGLKVPDVVRSGDHKKLDIWRNNTAAKKTVLSHFSWIRKVIKKREDIELASKFIPHHYVVLMHNQVLMADGNEGNSSVTSLDIHDIARSANTYGIKNYFIVTELADQQKVIKKLLSFWNEQSGFEYNPHRHEAVGKVILCSSLNEVIDKIKEIESNEPLLIATGASEKNGDKLIGYYDQTKIWSYGRPVLFIFGTSRGLGPSVMELCDYILIPVKGFSTFNHLSVRSAAAIILDRWLGINTQV